MSDLIAVAAISSGGLIVVAAISAWSNRRTRDIVKSVKTGIDSVNKAVNHQETGLPTLVQRTIDQDARSIQLGEDLAKFREWQTSTMKVMAERLFVQLPEPPADVVPPEIALPSGEIPQTPS